MSTRYFYHSFPREPDPDVQLAKGLGILSSILESGLLLTPELIPFSEARADGTASPEVVLQQKRICFTELAEHELPAHGQRFGHFALEWDIASLRGLGAIPVFYVPLGPTSNDLSGVAASLLMRLGEAEAVLARLKDLKTVARSLAPNRHLHVTRDGEVV